MVTVLDEGGVPAHLQRPGSCLVGMVGGLGRQQRAGVSRKKGPQPRTRWAPCREKGRMCGRQGQCASVWVCRGTLSLSSSVPADRGRLQHPWVRGATRLRGPGPHRLLEQSPRLAGTGLPWEQDPLLLGDGGGRGDCGGRTWRLPGPVAPLVGCSKPSWDLGSDHLPHGTES